MFYWFIRYCVLGLSKIFFPFKVYGLDNIPAEGAFVYASNHISYLDPVVLAISCRRRISFVAKDTLFKNKPFGLFLAHLDAFPIKRDSADIGAIKETLRRLKQGRAVLIFPEGTRVQDPAHREVQSGIGMIVAKSGVPVIPVHVAGTSEVLPEGAKFFRRHEISIHIGEPINFSPELPYQTIAQQIMVQIDALASLP